MDTANPDGWDDERVARWLRQADALDRQIRPVSEVLFAAAALQPGERVLDVGCGTGPTTRQAAAAVGPSGAVTGLDVAGEMLAAAARLPVPAGAAPIEWVEADPVAWRPGAADHDVVLSRFGVMFFSDPAAAFAHLAEATRAGGRLAVATWAPRAESDLFQVPVAAALEVLGREDDLPQDEGAFSLGDPAAVRALLTAAGWDEVASVVHHLRLPYAGGEDPAAAARASVDVGHARAITRDLDDATRARVIDAIAAALEAHRTDDGVVLGGTVLVTTARRR